MHLSDRMKRYEKAMSAQLPDRLPVIIRVDGKAFHTYTSSLKKNDPNMIAAMWAASTQLCQQIVGARLAYVQSDEISVLIYPWQNLNSQSWFGNTLQKMVSVSASIASSTVTAESINVFGKIKPAYFDSRVFVLPEEEINNYFIWRQQDAIRNSVQMQMYVNFGHKESQGKNRQEMIEALKTKGIAWDNLPVHIQRGACIIKREVDDRTKWSIDDNIPQFSLDRSYVNDKIRSAEDVTADVTQAETASS